MDLAPEVKNNLTHVKRKTLENKLEEICLVTFVTDITFYVLALYFGSVGVTRYRYAIISGLAADFTTLVASVFIVNKVFGAEG